MTYEVRVMVGIPGSGKSTLANTEMQLLEADGHSVAYISRDVIRKEFVGENPSDYFGKEDEVFNEFIRQINESLELGIDYVFVDATHISKGSRRKLVKRLQMDFNTRLVFEVAMCEFAICAERNALRTGFARVPDSALLRMQKGFTIPSPHEFDYFVNPISIRVNKTG